MVGETTTPATAVDRATVELCIHILRGNFGAGRGSEALQQRNDDIAILETLLTGPSPYLPFWPMKLTPVLREVLGLMCFQLGPVAHVYRDAGEFVDGEGAALKSRAEDEQAFMLHKIVGIALEHGEKWDDFVQADINRAAAVVAARATGARA